MDYVYHDMLIEAKVAQKNVNNRLLMYAKIFQKFIGDNVECEARIGKKYFIKLFLNKESKREQKIYNKLKEWERKYPIMGIIFCTVLGGILVSLVAGIILEVILRFV